jgi:hypothetical protein
VGAGFRITSIFAKYINNAPCLSLGNLRREIIIKEGNGYFSYPKLGIDEIPKSLPSSEDAVAFVNEAIRNRFSDDGPIGGAIDIVLILQSRIEWIQGNGRPVLPVRGKELFEEFKKDNSKFTALKGNAALENCLREKII